MIEPLRAPYRTHRAHRAIEFRVPDFEMGYEAHARGAHVMRKQAGLAQPFGFLNRVETPARQIHDDDVALDRQHIEIRKPAQTAGQTRGARMILDQSFAMMAKRVQRSRGDDSSLPHPTPEALSEKPALRNSRPTRRDRRSHRRAEPLRVTHRNRI